MGERGWLRMLQIHVRLMALPRGVWRSPHSSGHLRGPCRPKETAKMIRWKTTALPEVRYSQIIAEYTHVYCKLSCHKFLQEWHNIATDRMRALCLTRSPLQHLPSLRVRNTLRGSRTQSELQGSTSSCIPAVPAVSR